MIILQPVVMIEPNIYTPSRLEKVKVISYQEFLIKYADNAKAVRIGEQFITAYNFGLNRWHIVVNEA